MPAALKHWKQRAHATGAGRMSRAPDVTAVCEVMGEARVAEVAGTSGNVADNVTGGTTGHSTACRL